MLSGVQPTNRSSVICLSTSSTLSVTYSWFGTFALPVVVVVPWFVFAPVVPPLFAVVPWFAFSPASGKLPGSLLFTGFSVFPAFSPWLFSSVDPGLVLTSDMLGSFSSKPALDVPSSFKYITTPVVAAATNTNVAIIIAIVFLFAFIFSSPIFIFLLPL